MNVKPVSSKAKAIALSLLIACSGLASTAFAAASTPGSVGIQGANRAAAAQTHSSSTNYELDYFHAYKTSKTYAIRLKNGLRASFDFDKGTATLTDVAGNRTTLPLQQVLLEANNGNSQAAAEMYDQMYQSISAANSDAITASVGPEGAGTHSRPPRGWGGIGGFGGGLWSPRRVATAGHSRSDATNGGWAVKWGHVQQLVGKCVRRPSSYPSAAEPERMRPERRWLHSARG